MSLKGFYFIYGRLNYFLIQVEKKEKPQINLRLFLDFILIFVVKIK